MNTPITRRDTLAALAGGLSAPALAESKPAGLTMVVMDPMAAALSCACVKGYAQRDYDELGAFLAKRVGRPVKVVFAESLTMALKEKAEGRADVIIGKESVVRAETKTSRPG